MSFHAVPKSEALIKKIPKRGFPYDNENILYVICWVPSQLARKHYIQLKNLKLGKLLITSHHKSDVWQSTFSPILSYSTNLGPNPETLVPALSVLLHQQVLQPCVWLDFKYSHDKTHRARPTPGLFLYAHSCWTGKHGSIHTFSLLP